MLDAAASFLVSDLLMKLTSPAVRRLRLLRELEDDVSALRDTMEQIQAVLQDAEKKQREQKAVEIWLKSIRSASVEMEDVLDEVSAEAMLRRLHVQRGIIYRVRAFFSFNHNKTMVRNRIAHKVNNIRKKLDAIAANKSNFDLSHAMVSMDAQGGGENQSRETSSLVNLSKICGRDVEMKTIIDKICNKDIVRCYVDDVRVYAIWGMGGVGKTTLAQLVYNHEKVRTHFVLRSWVYVSTEFEIEKLTRKIIESIDGYRCELSQLDRMQVNLQNRLRGKRFLIVLDDVWNDNRTKWDEVSKALSCGAEGSIVMVTTHSQSISTMMAKAPEFVHKVGCLSKEDSWSLFKMLAFGVEKEEEDIRELEPIGMEIVEKCKGLPLALKALGSLMWSRCSAIEWQWVNESDIWELQNNEVHILPALEISYNNLPPHMKRCFAYCCMFPKGYELTADLLIQLWIANGFIPLTGDADLYVLGEEIFNCLVWRSFFQDVQVKTLKLKINQRWTPINQKICKMHDVMHDLARYVMRHDCSVIEPGKMLITPDQVLHLSSSCPDLVLSDQDSEKLRSLRSMFIFAREYKGKISQISEHKYLRVLYLMGIGGTTLPESIGELKHLRYLNLSGSNISVLPSSIIYLQNLQALILQSCMELCKLPDGIRYMRNLECLDIKHCSKLMGMPAGMKELTGLRRLSSFFVGKGKAARIGELGGLNLLGDELEIVALENVEDLSDVKKANLKSKRNLVSLVLAWTKFWRPDPYAAVKVLEGLEPNSSLTELEIRNYPGYNISPSRMVNLRNLVKIKFWNFERCECFPPLGKLPNLRIIDLYGIDRLKCFHDEDNTTTGDHTLFPRLQELSITECWNFLELPSHFPKLERLNISTCLKLHSLPSNTPKLRELEINDCPGLLYLPDGMQDLKELSLFRISLCEDLARRCEKDIGEDWSKISHVPNIRLH